MTWHPLDTERTDRIRGGYFYRTQGRGHNNDNDPETQLVKPPKLHQTLNYGVKSLDKFQPNDKVMDAITYGDQLILDQFIRAYFANWVENTERLSFCDKEECKARQFNYIPIKKNGLEKAILEGNKKKGRVTVDGLILDSISGTLFPIIIEPKLGNNYSSPISYSDREKLNKMDDCMSGLCIVTPSKLSRSKNFISKINRSSGKQPPYQFAQLAFNPTNISDWAENHGLKRNYLTMVPKK